ncbi:MAG: ribbon-helix-helix protein, CopG family [Actinomycetota bacterium]|nr:ribbon-helix-helix protein, CopG family [Actinomycetota bacterium]
MPTKHPRVQVTVDPELAGALAELGAGSSSRSQLIRDLALRGAETKREELRRRGEAIEYLLRIADGEVDYDFDALREVYEARGDHLR